jgi:hypothetical protein
MLQADQNMVDASVQMPKLSMGSNGNHHHRTLNAGSNPHSALRTKENNCQQGLTPGYLNDQLKGNKRNTFYANASSNNLQKINSKTHALTNRNLSFHSTNSTRLGTQPVLGNN